MLALSAPGMTRTDAFRAVLCEESPNLPSLGSCGRDAAEETLDGVGTVPPLQRELIRPLAMVSHGHCRGACAAPCRLASVANSLPSAGDTVCLQEALVALSGLCIVDAVGEHKQNTSLGALRVRKHRATRDSEEEG